ncbi:MAG TPA: KEOPS complex subunit Cgi121 [Methanoregula sp.]|nr:KEOPS complex subunit Cgi121 [Methanoregula sp.]
MEPEPLSCEIGYAVVTVSDHAAFLETLRAIAVRNNTRIVCFDAEKLAGRRHAETALRHAHRAFAEGTAISNSFEMEALLYAAGSRQCSVGVSFGLHDGENHLYVCCCPAPEGVWKDLAAHLQFGGEPCEIMSPQKATRLCALFDVTPDEIAAVGEDRIADLVLERVAMLEVNK